MDLGMLLRCWLHLLGDLELDERHELSICGHKTLASAQHIKILSIWQTKILKLSNPNNRFINIACWGFEFTLFFYDCSGKCCLGHRDKNPIWNKKLIKVVKKVWACFKKKRTILSFFYFSQIECFSMETFKRTLLEGLKSISNNMWKY